MVQPDVERRSGFEGYLVGINSDLPDGVWLDLHSETTVGLGSARSLLASLRRSNQGRYSVLFTRGGPDLSPSVHFLPPYSACAILERLGGSQAVICLVAKGFIDSLGLRIPVDQDDNGYHLPNEIRMLVHMMFTSELPTVGQPSFGSCTETMNEPPLPEREIWPLPVQSSA